MQSLAEFKVEGPGEDLLDDICVALVNQGYFVLDAALPADLVQALQQEAQALPRDSFHLAGTGREAQHQLDTSVRSDRIHWMERSTAASIRYLDFAEILREGINSRLFLGLFEYECHYACYPPGAFYAQHRDAFSGSRNRLVSTVLYLNPDWEPGDGGELVLYAEDGVTKLECIQPVLNRMVLFLSELFPHEVLQAQRHRYSIAGWFRVNATRSSLVDPLR